MVGCQVDSCQVHGFAEWPSSHSLGAQLPDVCFDLLSIVRSFEVSWGQCCSSTLLHSHLFEHVGSVSCCKSDSCWVKAFCSGWTVWEALGPIFSFCWRIPGCPRTAICLESIYAQRDSHGTCCFGSNHWTSIYYAYFPPDNNHQPLLSKLKKNLRISRSFRRS